MSGEHAIRIAQKSRYIYSVEIDGHDVANHVVGLHLDMAVGKVPELEIDFLGFDSHVEVSGVVTYVAYAQGHTGRGKTAVGALRDLIAALEDKGPTNG